MVIKHKARILYQAAYEGDTEKVLKLLSGMDNASMALDAAMDALIITKRNHHNETAESIKKHMEDSAKSMMSQELLTAAKQGNTSKSIEEIDKIKDTELAVNITMNASLISAINGHLKTALGLTYYAEKLEKSRLFNLRRN